MANIKYSDLIKEVLPFLAADPSDPLTESIIRITVMDLCAESWIWKHIPDPIDVVASELIYDIDVPNGASVAVVMDVAFSGTPIAAQNIEWLNLNYPGWQTESGSPRYYTQIETNQIILAPLSSENVSGGITLTVALQPSRSSSSFPEWIYNKFRTAIINGALANLMMFPGKPWTDIKNGAYRREQFDMAIAHARASSVHALGRASVRTTAQH